MARPSRRSRRSFARTKRSKNKTLIGGQFTTNANTLNSSTLYTAVYPCTMAGMRWDMDFVRASIVSENNIQGQWAIYILKEGNVALELSPTTIMQPEQNVIAWGVMSLGTIDSGVSKKSYMDKTKSMRKLQGGDKIMLAIKTVEAVSCVWGVQFFTLV